MDYEAYQTFLDERPGFFQTTLCTLRYLHIRRPKDAVSDQVEDGSVDEADLPSWLAQRSVPAAEGRDLKMIFVTLADITKSDIALKITRRAFDLILKDFDVPREFVKVTSGVHEVLNVEWEDSSGSFQFPKQKSLTCIQNYCKVVTLSQVYRDAGPHSSTTTCFVQCTDDKRITDIVERLSRNLSIAYYRYYVLLNLIGMAIDDLENDVADIRYVLNKVLIRLGFSTVSDTTMKELAKNPTYWESVDLHIETTNVHHCTGETLRISSRIDLMLQTLEGIEIRILSDSSEQLNPDGSEAHMWACRETRNAIGKLQSLAPAVKLLQGEAQAMWNPISSLIAQRDNAMNLKIAQLSLEIAKASRDDSVAMRALAEDSRLIAINTSRDSAAMRIIAAVTILFLPATFTATYFSTSFFDFQAPSGGPIVSRWHWIYWVSTVILTAVIHVSWYFTYKHREREIFRKFAVRDKEAAEPDARSEAIKRAETGLQEMENAGNVQSDAATGTQQPAG